MSIHISEAINTILTGKWFLVNEYFVANEAYQLAGGLAECSVFPIDFTTQVSRRKVNDFDARNRPEVLPLIGE